LIDINVAHERRCFKAKLALRSSPEKQTLSVRDGLQSVGVATSCNLEVDHEYQVSHPGRT